MTKTPPPSTPNPGVHAGIAVGGAVVALIGGLWAGRYSAPPPAPIVLAPSAPARIQSARIAALPDPNLTPGAIDAAVTQANIHQTLCVSGYAKTKRPPDDGHWQKRMKAICARYGWVYQRGAQEMDHLVPIEDGGAPNDDANVWPEPVHANVGGRDMGYHEKDKAENAVHQAICSDALPLDEARTQMRNDWRVLYRRFVGDFPAYPGSSNPP